MLMSPYNEWISQYHKILKVLFLNHYSSWKCMWLLWLACVDSHAHQWGDPSAVVWWMKALDRDVRNAPSLASSDAGLFYNSMLPFVYLPCKAQSIAETEEPRCLCTSMFCGAGMGFCLIFGLKLFGVLLSSHPPFVSVTVGASNGLYS